jgi:hypothetical protein
MSLRTFSAIAALLLAGCGSAGGDDKVATAAPESRIECATGGAERFSRSCAIERSGDGTRWTIRHADGGFRILDVTSDLAVSTADGAVPLTGQPLPDGRLEVVAGTDRYRLPPK